MGELSTADPGTVIKLRKCMNEKFTVVCSCHSLQNTLNLVTSRCCFEEDGEECTKCITHVQSALFFSLNLLFCDVLDLIAVVIVLIKFPITNWK